MFQDQGILRTADANQTPATTHNLGLAVWPDAQHYYDSAGNQGMDGIVYSDRTPQPDYWEVRKVYSPVQITPVSLPLRPGHNGFTLQVENRFDFRALNGVTLEWSLILDGRSMQRGALPLRTAARSTETIEFPVEWPADLPPGFLWLELRCVDSQGMAFYERGIRIDSLLIRSVLDSLRTSAAVSIPTIDESPAKFRVRNWNGELELNRTTGETTLRSEGGGVLATGLLPHAGRRLTEGEFMRSKKESPWTNALLTADSGLETSATRTDDGVLLRMHGRFSRPDAREQALEGEITLLVRNNGTIDVSYDLVPANGHGLLLEAGVALRSSPAATEFHWAGAGPYAGYPGKDALNEFGLYHLNRGDLNFSGNRRGVETAVLASPQGDGILVIPEAAADIAVENEPGGGVLLSHNALVSGRGTKFVAPDSAVLAENVPRIAGKFSIVTLWSHWPAPLTAWFGAPGAAKPFQPYYHSYDQ
jgi:beta-galactosidase